ncbi:MAG: bifunctional UDP-3-O-[3-hydroxymyristoyl] N-acetylglucosamine deacetylase/3-hydroxyacyl-ACP dehydratase [Puniceicoccales bacterium]|jgi:UDP-3-O-[3-hydroxymyristoyl] N-acetylglucosamine deacetylase/3-hydroxyacyl-[acyl-carrier-protein] dehydratase|nr:bifunctional UDP-3-O-[3-hydroxymyristoyl] N-acetylglucosamine deacetylase/3-hydroxyacyl-ACP dehydratase [Puniceicoccales bacterium]
MKQRTILREVTASGKALHTGNEVTLKIKPAPVNTGIIFRRIDQFGVPEIKVCAPSLGSDTVRCTTLIANNTTVHTVEHVLSALNGLQIGNVIIEMNASEPPILDGSAKHYVNLLLSAEPVDQEKDKTFFVLKEPISVSYGNRSLIALPYDGLKITCTSADDRGVYTQHLSIDIDEKTYISEIAPARTFTIYGDIEELLRLGKIKGGSLDSAVVIKDDKILSKEPLRFKDEFVRHKILDIIGDLAVLGMPLKAHIIAVRPGHTINAELIRRMHNRGEGSAETGAKQGNGEEAKLHESVMDIYEILNNLPHRYPFLLVDRITKFTSGTELRAIKNVTMNEPYFPGHFPGQPVMPGVLQIEAMAQAAGLLMIKTGNLRNKLAYFMSCDKVKFRRAVVPGDQLVIDVKLTKSRGNKIGVAVGECRVDGKVASSAELMFTIIDNKD